MTTPFGLDTYTKTVTIKVIMGITLVPRVSAHGRLKKKGWVFTWKSHLYSTKTANN